MLLRHSHFLFIEKSFHLGIDNIIDRVYIIIVRTDGKKIKHYENNHHIQTHNRFRLLYG